MVYRIQLTYNEIVDNMYVEYIAASTIGYTIPPGMYKITDINRMIKSIIPHDEKINIGIDDIRLKSNSTINKTTRFTERCFFM